ncbi:family 43 glycosylhydrolase [candidate division KSB1 bacterium]|nr:family 43 glycosylhydrolase [candidate division KSB1 bacterium]
MKNRNFILHTVLLLATLIACIHPVHARNPLFTHIYAADPSAHIWPVDRNRLWLYTSHDVPGTNHHATMFDYHVFSTTDLVHWTDYGRVFSVDDADWAIGYAWAIDAMYRHGQYYLVYCMIEAATGMFRTGLAISKRPQGPFTDIGFIKGVEWGQDPCLYVDDDDTPFLFWGAGGKCSAVQLTDDLLSAIPETRVDLTDQLFEVFEGPWVHKYQGKYYLSYPGLPNGQWPEEMYYAIADKPLGPYKSMDKYIPVFEGHSGTNHGSIIQFKGQWLAFHHSAIVSGGMSEVRNLMADVLHYNPDGTIQPIIPDPNGITNGEPVICTILLEAENGKLAGGRLAGTFVETDYPDYSGDGYVTGFDVSQDYVEVLAQVSNDMQANLKIRMSAENDFKADVLVGVKMLAGWDGLPVTRTDGWHVVNFGPVNLKAGDNRIRFTCKQDVHLRIDYFIVKPICSE